MRATSRAAASNDAGSEAVGHAQAHPLTGRGAPGAGAATRGPSRRSRPPTACGRGRGPRLPDRLRTQAADVARGGAVLHELGRLLVVGLGHEPAAAGAAMPGGSGCSGPGRYHGAGILAPDTYRLSIVRIGAQDGDLGSTWRRARARRRAARRGTADGDQSVHPPTPAARAPGATSRGSMMSPPPPPPRAASPSWTAGPTGRADPAAGLTAAGSIRWASSAPRWRR
jgi:hypothetical protein